MPRRRDSKGIAADRIALWALTRMEDYRPANESHSVSALQELEAALRQAEQEEERAQEAVAAAQMAHRRASFTRAELDKRFRAAMRGAKTQVVAQYGEDSHQVTMVGWKRSSDRRRPGRRPQPQR